MRIKRLAKEERKKSMNVNRVLDVLIVGIVFLAVLFFIGLIGMIFCDHEFWHGIFVFLFIIGFAGLCIMAVNYSIAKEIKIWRFLDR